MTSDARPLDLRTTKARGDHAERRALAHLMANGLVPVERNYRVARGPSARGGEVDLILRDRDGTLVFVEVRMRSSRGFGGAAESITAQKRARMIAAARGYLAVIGGEPACRFDAILMQRLDAACIDWRRDIVDVE